MFKSFKARITITFFLAASLILVVSFTALYLKAVRDQMENIRSQLKMKAALGVAFLQAEEVTQVPLEPGCQNDPLYQKVSGDLRKFTVTDKNIYDAYVMVPTPRHNAFRFVANANQQFSPVRCGEEYDATPYPEIAEALKYPSVDKKITRDKWGSWLSAYAPIYARDGHAVAIFGVDVAEKTIQELRQVYLWRFLFVITIALALALFCGVMASRWLVHPLNQVIAGMSRVSEGDFHYRVKPTDQIEFNQIVVIFNQMTKALNDLLKELAEKIREKERLTKELEMAADLQRKALPEGYPTVAGLEIAAKSIPAKEVGGDYYDFIVRGAERVGFVIADAAGKGFPGSLFMTNTRSAFRVVSANEHAVGRALERTNDFISENAASAKGMFITFLYAVYEMKTRQLTYSNAGHYPPIVYNCDSRTFKVLSAVGGLPMGIISSQIYPEVTVSLAKGDIVLMYTDGLIEAMNSSRDMFGLSRLMKIVEAHFTSDTETLIKKIEESLKAFVGDEPPSDDRTLMVLKVR